MVCGARRGKWLAVFGGQHAQHDGERWDKHGGDVEGQRLGAPEEGEQHDHCEAGVLLRVGQQLQAEQRRKDGKGESEDDGAAGAPPRPPLVGIAAVLLHTHDGRVALELGHVSPHRRPLVRERGALPQRLERGLGLIDGLVVELRV